MNRVIKSMTRVARMPTMRAIALFSTKNMFKASSTSPLFSRNTLMFSTGSGSPFENVQKGEFTGPGFYVKQLLTGCLSIYSYYIESGNEAFLIDPLNETKKYEQILKQRGKTLKGVFLTHYHADYIAGHLQLQKKYGGEIYLGPKALSSFGIKVTSDGQEIKLGTITLKVIHTPGHTEESSCVLLIDENGKSQCLFTGDTVFLNEVGRPDLAVKTDLTSKDLAGMLFDSLQKIKKLDDNIRIYPGHGAGSSCGKNIGKGDFCDLQTQKKNNYGLKEEIKEKFVQAVLNQMPKPPQYFGYNAGVNKFNPFDYEQAYKSAMRKIPASELKNTVTKSNAVIIDIRDKKSVEKNMIAGAICIDFEGAFVNWVGTMIDQNSNLVIFGPEQKARDSIERLLRIGYKNIQGYCSDSLEELSKDFKIYTPDFVTKVHIPGRKILDVRKPAQWKNGIVANGQVVKLQLSQLLADHEKVLNKNQKYVVHCQSGYRARIAYGILKDLGYDVVVFGEAGFADFPKYGIETTKGQQTK